MLKRLQESVRMEFCESTTSKFATPVKKNKVQYSVPKPRIMCIILSVIQKMDRTKGLSVNKIKHKEQSCQTS